MTEKQDDPSTTPSTLTSRTGSGATSYKEMWAGLALETPEVDEFYKLFPLHEDPKELWELVLDLHPKKFPVGLLTLVEVVPGDYFVVPLHSLEKARGVGPEFTLRKEIIAIEGDVSSATSIARPSLW